MRTNTYNASGSMRARKFQAKKTFIVRLVMLLVLIGFSATSGVMLHASANEETIDAPAAAAPPADSAAEHGAAASILCVEPGDTLWKIAKTYGPDGVSVKAYVQRIIDANGLESASLQVGQVLRLP